MPTHANRIGEIHRRDGAYENTGRPRLGGSSYSSGVFREVNATVGRLWLGKAEPAFRYVRDTEGTVVGEEYHEGLTEGPAIAEKIANDIYAYYGASVPQVEISRQRLTNTWDPADRRRHAIHVMSEMIDNFSTYKQGVGEAFSCIVPTPDGCIRLSDGRRLPERGLGKILAVAAFIRDADVIGGSGGNIGYQVCINENGEYAQSVKIDPGAAFSDYEGLRDVRRHIQVALNAEPNQLNIDTQPPHTRAEFFLTLHDIINTNEATIRGFFNRRGGERFIEYSERSIEEFTALLMTRKEELSIEYAEDLEETLEAYQAQAVRPTELEAMLRAAEEEALLQQLYYYIAPYAEVGSVEEVREAVVNEQGTIQEQFRQFQSSRSTVLLVHGGSGSGKSISLLKLKLDCLEAKRADHTLAEVLHIELKRYNEETVRDCVRDSMREAHLDIEELRQRPVLLLLDGYDEISGHYQRNLYRDNQLEQFTQLKVIITCRSEALRPRYRAWFAPDHHPESYQEMGLLPFVDAQIAAYVDRYSQQHPSAIDFQQHIETLPGLQDLVSTPLLLRIVCMALPRLLTQENDSPITRPQLYKAFLQQWFGNQEARLRSRFRLPENWSAFGSFESFSTGLALALCAAGELTVSYDAQVPENAWSRFFTEAVFVNKVVASISYAACSN